jgi:uracil-DNA glycosylase family 4
VAGFGDPDARVVIVGLAPAAHGANRTGRAFTGDRSGDFLFAALHRAGFANQPSSVSRSDGLRLRDVFITLALRCAPPANRPLPDELRSCASFLDQELALLPRARVVLALGAIGWNAVVDHLVRRESPTGSKHDPKGFRSTRGPRPKFGHGAVAFGSPFWLVGSFHVSQQNTQTGRLTPPMFDAVLAQARRLAATPPPPKDQHHPFSNASLRTH